MKIKLKSLFCGLCALGFLSSCSTYLTPASPGSNLGYLPKAMVVDSIKTLTSISASLAGGSSPDAKVSYEMGMINISAAHTFKEFNIGYGLFGYTGKAENSSTTNSLKYPEDYLPQFKKNYFGAGLRFSAGLHSTSENGNTDFRYINFENAVNFENGPYTDFRRQIYRGFVPNYVAVTDRSLIWTTGLSSEIIWRGRRNHDIKHAFRLFIGGSPTLNNGFRYGSSVSREKDVSSGGWVVNYFLNVKRFYMSLEMASTLNYSQKISLGYTFK